MDSESDSEEFYDAPEEVSSSPARKATRERGNRQTSTNQYEDELRLLEEEKRKAEEKRQKEDEIMQQKIRELEEKKREEEEREQQRLKEELERLQKEREAEEKRRLEEEERQREEQEAEERRQEAIRKRKRLEQMRRNEDGEESDDTRPGYQGQPEPKMPSDAELVSTESDPATSSTDPSERHEPSEQMEREPGLANRNVEPDVIASTKERPSELPLSGTTSPSAEEPSPSSTVPPQAAGAADDMPPPVAPPRRKKKQKKMEEISRQESLDSHSSSALSVSLKEPSEEGSLAGGDEQPIGLPPEGQGRPLSGLLTPTTTIESLTRELEHSLDLASAVHGGDYIIHHKDTQSIKGESRADLKVQGSRLPESIPKEVKQGGACVPVSSSSSQPDKPDKPSRGNTPETEKLLKYYNLMQGQSMTGEELTDEEILSQVIVKNLDTGETVPLLLAEERLPKCINPLSLHIMRITSEYVSNSSLDKEAGSDGEKETGTTEVAHQIKEKKKKLKKFLGKTVHKLKTAADEAFRHDDQEISEEESIPDARYCKFKAASSHKGSYDFDQLVNCQDLSGEHTGAIWTMRFSHCGRLLATGGQDHLLRVWVLKDYYKYFDDMRQRYNNESRAKSQTQGSSDSSSSSLERDRKPEEIEEEREQLKKEVMEMEGSIEKEEAARRSASAEKKDTSLEDVDQEEEDREAVFAKAPFFTYSGHTADLLDISWSKNYFILSSSMDKMVRLWHISRSECLCCFQHIDFVTAIAFHPRDDRYFLSGSLDGKLRLWNIPDKKVALWNEVDGPTKLITAANFIQNGRFSVVGTYDGRCIFYDTEHLKYYTQIHVRSTRGRNAKGRKITAIEPLPSQDKILVTSNDSRIRLYDLRDLSLACKYKGCTNISSQIKASFSHNHRYIVCGSEDHAFYIWKTHYDFAKFTSVRRDRNDFWESIRVHDAVTTSVVFSPNPKLVLGSAPPSIQSASGLDPQQLVGGGSASPSPTSKKERSDSGKGEPGGKEGKHSSLKRPPDVGEVLVSADFNGAIKVFIKHPK